MIWLRILAILAAWSGVRGQFGPSSQTSCSFQRGGYSLDWWVDASQIVHFNLTFVNFPDNSWTGVGFGDSMNAGLDVIIVALSGLQVNVIDASVQGYTAPTPNARNDITVQSTSYLNNVLRAQFTRPMDTGFPSDRPLTGCVNWNFIISPGAFVNGQMQKHGQTPIQVNICNIASLCPQPGTQQSQFLTTLGYTGYSTTPSPFYSSTAGYQTSTPYQAQYQPVQNQYGQQAQYGSQSQPTGPLGPYSNVQYQPYPGGAGFQQPQFQQGYPQGYGQPAPQPGQYQQGQFQNQPFIGPLQPQYNTQNPVWYQPQSQPIGPYNQNQQQPYGQPQSGPLPAQEFYDPNQQQLGNYNSAGLLQAIGYSQPQQQSQQYGQSSPMYSANAGSPPPSSSLYYDTTAQSSTGYGYSTSTPSPFYSSTQSSAYTSTFGYGQPSQNYLARDGSGQVIPQGTQYKATFDNVYPDQTLNNPPPDSQTTPLVQNPNYIFLNGPLADAYNRNYQSAASSYAQSGSSALGFQQGVQYNPSNQYGVSGAQSAFYTTTTQPPVLSNEQQNQANYQRIQQAYAANPNPTAGQVFSNNIYGYNYSNGKRRKRQQVRQYTTTYYADTLNWPAFDRANAYRNPLFDSSSTRFFDVAGNNTPQYLPYRTSTNYNVFPYTNNNGVGSPGLYYQQNPPPPGQDGYPSQYQGYSTQYGSAAAVAQYSPSYSGQYSSGYSTQNSNPGYSAQYSGQPGTYTVNTYYQGVANGTNGVDRLGYVVTPDSPEYQQTLARDQQILSDYTDVGCQRADPYWCQEYVQTFISGQMQYNGQSQSSACSQLVASLQYADNRCCQSARAAGCQT